MKLHRGFEYIKNAYSYFVPTTPKSALRAVRQHVLPAEAFVYRASSVKPIYEEPFDIREIERVLAKEDIDLKTLVLIIEILQKLIHDKDSERALFAAESLNEIETRFTGKINRLKEKLKESENIDLVRQIGVTYYELALVSVGRSAIRNFYLKEAFNHLNGVISSPLGKKSDFIYTIDILLQLKLYSQAQKILETADRKFEDDPDLQMMNAENEFYRKNFAGVIRLCKQCNTASFSKEAKELADFWRGR